MDIMIDIESFDVEPTAVIISIGYVIFDPLEQGDMGGEQIVVNPDTQKNRSTSWDTIKFHLGLPQEAHKYLLRGEEVHLKIALRHLAHHIGVHKPERVWANFVCFDIGVLENAYRQCGLPIPWEFHQIHDTKTLYRFCGITKEDKAAALKALGGEAHTPLTDCRVQVKLLQQCYFQGA